MPVKAVCRNCETPTVGRYCHICGQDMLAGRGHRLREIVGDSLGTIFAWDSKVLATLWYLVAFPGRLTGEFYAGRIVRYVFPSKLFWFLSLVFFALMLTLTDPQVVVSRSDDGITAADSPKTEQPEAIAPIPEIITDTPKEIERERGAALDANIGDKNLLEYITTWGPYLMLLLVPLFAALVWLLFRRRERSYSDYLVFSLHFNSFVFLMLSLLVVTRKIFPGADLAGRFTVWIQAVYLGVAIRRVYRPRIVPMILKIVLLGLIYIIAMVTIIVVFSIIFVFIIKNIDTFAR